MSSAPQTASERLPPPGDDAQGLANLMAGDPYAILEQAAAAAKALQEVIANKPKKVIIQGKQYLECEDWQTVARFFGCTARLEWTKPIEFGDALGFEARYEVVRLSDGLVIGAGEGMCLNSEPRWAAAPSFHLRSMAQTRGASRALNSVFRWVAVLAKFERTPAEEMEEDPRGAQDQIIAQRLESNTKAFFDEIKKEKSRLTQFESNPGAGEKEYYRILGTYGAQHANDPTFLYKADATAPWVVSKNGQRCYMDIRRQARQWGKMPSPEVTRRSPTMLNPDDFSVAERNDIVLMLMKNGTITEGSFAKAIKQLGAYLRKYEGTKDDLMEEAARYVTESQGREPLELVQADAEAVAARAGVK